MSRIGILPIEIPKGVQITVSKDNVVSVKMAPRRIASANASFCQTFYERISY